jgi:hypothetical protein
MEATAILSESLEGAHKSMVCAMRQADNKTLMIIAIITRLFLRHLRKNSATLMNEGLRLLPSTFCAGFG